MSSTFLFYLCQNKIFTMKQLTLLQLIFALLFVGKIAQIGQLTTLPWLWVITPLILHYIKRFFSWVAEKKNIKGMVEDSILLQRMNAQDRKIKRVYNNSVEKFKKTIEDGNAN